MHLHGSSLGVKIASSYLPQQLLQLWHSHPVAVALVAIQTCHGYQYGVSTGGDSLDKAPLNSDIRILYLWCS